MAAHPGFPLLKSELGSAVVDFILVAVPMLLVSVTTVTICLASFTQVVIKDAAIEAARFAALADQDAQSGCARAKSQIVSALGSVNPGFNCISKIDSSANFLLIELSMPVRLLGMLSSISVVRGIGRAPLELQ